MQLLINFCWVSLAHAELEGLELSITSCIGSLGAASTAAKAADTASPTALPRLTWSSTVATIAAGDDDYVIADIAPSLRPARASKGNPGVLLA